MFQETACAVERILEEFKGPAGLDVDGISLFKSNEAVDFQWAIGSKHLSCMQVSSLSFKTDIKRHCQDSGLVGP